MLVRLLKVLTNRPPTTTAFNRCDMQFAIQGEHVHFQQLNLLGDAVSLYGKGETNFDRELDLVFYTLIGPADLPIPLWKIDRRPGEPAGVAAEGRRQVGRPGCAAQGIAGRERHDSTNPSRRGHDGASHRGARRVHSAVEHRSQMVNRPSVGEECDK